MSATPDFLRLIMIWWISKLEFYKFNCHYSCWKVFHNLYKMHDLSFLFYYELWPQSPLIFMTTAHSKIKTSYKTSYRTIRKWNFIVAHDNCLGCPMYVPCSIFSYFLFISLIWQNRNILGTREDEILGWVCPDNGVRAGGFEEKTAN